MVLFILGLDGLDYRCVTQWNLVNLKQQEFGKIAVPISQGRKQPLSPEVWGLLSNWRRIDWTEFFQTWNQRESTKSFDLLEKKGEFWTWNGKSL